MNRVMKKKTGIHIENWWIIIALFIIHCSLFISPVRAQTFTERLQQDRSGAGKVTVTHSTDIDNLVNGVEPADTTKDARLTPHDSRLTPETRLTTDTRLTPDSVDTRKKVIKGGHKISGYRVQVYAGGNQRKDRQRAEQVGNELKSYFPDQPVYVHFYSPRWICRMGNYRTYEEAHHVLTNVKKLGFNAATIVKGKITVYQ